MNLLLFNLKTDSESDVLGFTTDWINALSTHFEKIFVMTMEAGRVGVNANVSVLSVGKEKGFSEVHRAWEFYRILTRLLAREKIDFCFAHMMPLFALMGWPLLERRGIPILMWYAHKAKPLTMRLAVMAAKRVVTPSKESFSIKSDKVHVIGHAVNTSIFRPLTQDQEKDLGFLYVGRITPIKRMDLALSAMNIVVNDDPQSRIKLSIVGTTQNASDDLYFADLRKLVRTYGLQERVEFVGRVPYHAVPNYYLRSACVLNLCGDGSVDKAVLEAMSCGLPVITTNRTYEKLIGPELSDLCYTNAAEWGVAERMKSILAMPSEERNRVGVRLRETVLQGHSLHSLGCRLVAQMKEMRPETHTLGQASLP